MRWVSSSQRSTCSVLRRSWRPVVAPVAGDVPAVVGLLAPEGMAAVVVPEGVVAVGALEGMAAVAVPGRVAALVGALARPGAPAELSLSLPSLPAALRVVGHPGSTGCDFPEILLTGVGVPRSTTPPVRAGEDTGAAHEPATVAGFPFTTATPSCEIEARDGPLSVRNWRVW